MFHFPPCLSSPFCFIVYYCLNSLLPTSFLYLLQEWQPAHVIDELKTLHPSLSKTELDQSPFVPSQPAISAKTVSTASVDPQVTATDHASTAAPSTNPDAIWFYVDQYQAQQGPATKLKLRNLYVASSIVDETPVWMSTMPEWKPISTVEELASVVAPVTTEERQRFEKRVGIVSSAFIEGWWWATVAVGGVRCCGWRVWKGAKRDVSRSVWFLFVSHHFCLSSYPCESPNLLFYFILLCCAPYTCYVPFSRLPSTLCRKRRNVSEAERRTKKSGRQWRTTPICTYLAFRKT